MENPKLFGIAAGFDSFNNKDEESIEQYQPKYEKDVECGGGYVEIGWHHSEELPLNISLGILRIC